MSWNFFRRRASLVAIALAAAIASSTSCGSNDVGGSSNAEPDAGSDVSTDDTSTDDVGGQDTTDEDAQADSSDPGDVIETIEVRPQRLELQAGDTAQLSAVALNAQGVSLSEVTFTWSTDDAQVISVDDAGEITALGVGTASVFAAADGIEGVADVEVLEADGRTVTLSEQAIALVAGESLDVNAEVLDANGDPVRDAVVSWSTDDEAIATVDADGVVSALSPGSTTLRASSEGAQATALIEVSSVPVARVELIPSTAQTLIVGDLLDVDAIAYDGQDNELASRSVTWTSSDEAIAAVDADGVVEALSVGGPVDITAQIEGVSETLQVAVEPENQPPVAVAQAASPLRVGQQGTLDASGSSDPEDAFAALSFAWRLIADPSGGADTIGDAGQAVASFTPSARGTYEFEVAVTDTAGATTTDTVVVLVENSAPTFTSVAPTATDEASAFLYEITTADPDGDAVTITGTQQTSLPAWLTLTDRGDGTASLAGTPAQADVGTYQVALKVEDTNAASSQQVFSLTVNDVENAPVFTSSPGTSVDQEVRYFYTVQTSDADGDIPTLSATLQSGDPLPDWFSFSDNGDGTADLEAFGEDENVGTWDIVITAEDGVLTATQSFTLTINNVNDPPMWVLPSPATDVTVGDAYSATLVAIDIDEDTLTVTAAQQNGDPLPSWLSDSVTDLGVGDPFGAGTDYSAYELTLTGSPTASDVGTWDIEVIAEDNALTRVFTFSITVKVTNTAPTFTSTPNTNAPEDSTYAYNITATDPDGDALVITANAQGGGPLPSWLTLTDNGDGTATLTGAPDQPQVGTWPVVLTVSDGPTSDTQAFDITVANVNDGPSITSSAVATAREDQAYQYNITSEDQDGDSVTITAELSGGGALPAWLSFTDNGDGTADLAGIPTNDDVGSFAVSLTVSDGTLDVTQGFNLLVINVNDAPTITSAPIEDATEDTLYAYEVTAEDIDVGDTLTLTADTQSGAGLPSWLSFTDNGDGTGTLSGTPSNDDLGDYALEITVDDNTVTRAQTFTITVANVNDPPTITSTPVTRVDEDSSYLYTITADDVDPVPTLIISAQVAGGAPLPPWLNLFDNGDGTASLEGSPITGDAGAYDIVVQVTDTIETVEQSFTLIVNAPPMAMDDTVTSTQDTDAVAYVLYNDSDPEGDALTVSIASSPAQGSATVVDNAVVFVPPVGLVGNFVVDYEVSDGSASATASVNFDVAGAATPTAAGAVVITEIMNNPDELLDSQGEWLEIYNPGSSAIDLAGCTLSDDGSDSTTIDYSLHIPPGEYAAVATALRPGFAPRYIWSSYALSNGADEVVITCGGTEIDRVEYDGGPNFPDPTGASMTLSPTALSATFNDSGTTWCEATSPFNGSDLGTPGQPNDACP